MAGPRHAQRLRLRRAPIESHLEALNQICQPLQILQERLDKVPARARCIAFKSRFDLATSQLFFWERRERAAKSVNEAAITVSLVHSDVVAHGHDAPNPRNDIRRDRRDDHGSQEVFLFAQKKIEAFSRDLHRTWRYQRDAHSHSRTNTLRGSLCSHLTFRLARGGSHGC